MTRIFIFLLLFAVVFLSGMLMGIDRENGNNKMDIEKVLAIFENKEPILEDKTIVEEEIIPIEQAMNMDTPVHLTQKTASLLEAGVKGFYEVVVEVLYQITTLFF